MSDENIAHAVTNQSKNFINQISYDENIISLLKSTKPKNNSKTTKSEKNNTDK